MFGIFRGIKLSQKNIGAFSYLIYQQGTLSNFLGEKVQKRLETVSQTEIVPAEFDDIYHPRSIKTLNEIFAVQLTNQLYQEEGAFTSTERNDDLFQAPELFELIKPIENTKNEKLEVQPIDDRSQFYLDSKSIDRIEPISNFDEWDSVPFNTLSNTDYDRTDFFCNNDDDASDYWKRYKSSDHIIW